MEYKTETTCGVGIIVLPESHRHYAISVEYNKAKLAGFTPKVFIKVRPGSEFLPTANPLWDSEFEYELRFLDEYEDREIQVVSRISQYTYREKIIKVHNALTFSTTHRLAHNRPVDTTVYVISLHTNCAFVETVAWLKSVYAPINHYIVFDNEEDYKNAIRAFENSGHTLQIA